ncbi:unnamed protein product [Eretmochelys imbricata]
MGLCAALGTGRGAGSAPPQPPLSPPPGPACGKRGPGAAASAAPGARLASSCLPSAGGARAELGERGPRCWGTARLCWEGRAAADGAGKTGARKPNSLSQSTGAILFPLAAERAELSPYS